MRIHRVSQLSAAIGIGMLVLALLVIGNTMTESADQTMAQTGQKTPATAECKLPECDVAPNAVTLWNEILFPANGQDYTHWKFFPEPGVSYPFSATEEPHGDFIVVYVNEQAYNSIANPSDPFEMQVGSVLVKENYPASPEPPSLDRPITDRDGLLSRTVMWKVRGYTQGGGPAKIVCTAVQGVDVPYMVGGEMFFAMYEGKGASRDPSQPVVTISAQPFVIGTDQFRSFVGETLSGKPWFCVKCHHFATGPQQAQACPGMPPRRGAYGDYIWRLTPFQAHP